MFTFFEYLSADSAVLHVGSDGRKTSGDYEYIAKFSNLNNIFTLFSYPTQDWALSINQGSQNADDETAPKGALNSDKSKLVFTWAPFAGEFSVYVVDVGTGIVSTI